VELALELLALLQFARSLHEVVLNGVVAVSPDSKHARLCAHHAHVGAVEVLAKLGNCFKVKVALLADVFGVDFQNVQSTGLVRKRNLDLAIHAARAQKSRIECVGSVRGHHALYFADVLKTIKLVQKLH